MEKFNRSVIHEMINYLHQIISNAEYIEEHTELSEYVNKIKNSAYSIDALLTDSFAKKLDVDIKAVSGQTIDLSKFKDLNVLIVDDLAENIRIMKNIFKTLSCNIFIAMSGEEAIQLYKNGCKPDIVSMDMIMPGIDGATTVKELKKLSCEAYFIAVSALKNQTNDVVSVFDCWVSKPFTSNQIRCALFGYNDKKSNNKKTITFKLGDGIDIKTLRDILYLAQNGAYSELNKLISILPDSNSKRFLELSLKKIDFNSIIESIEIR